MFKQKDDWKPMPSDVFQKGDGRQKLLLSTKSVRVYLQNFSSDAVIKTHSHFDTWETEIIVRFGMWSMLSIHRPYTRHTLSSPLKNGKRWSILSIKIGKV